MSWKRHPSNVVVAFIRAFQLEALVDALRRVGGWPG
jgi:hypothetical protein